MDDHTYFDIMPDWAKNITVGFARMEGHPVGVVANNPLFLAGCLDIDSSTKVEGNNRFNDWFNKRFRVGRSPLNPV